MKIFLQSLLNDDNTVFTFSSTSPPSWNTTLRIVLSVALRAEYRYSKLPSIDLCSCALGAGDRKAKMFRKNVAYVFHGVISPVRTP